MLISIQLVLPRGEDAPEAQLIDASGPQTFPFPVEETPVSWQQTDKLRLELLRLMGGRGWVIILTCVWVSGPAPHLLVRLAPPSWSI